MPQSESTELTMCLCNYARPEQTHQIIGELKQQSCKPRIFVWNNNPDYDFKDDRADWIINSNRNGHTRHVIFFWQQASTPYVARMDDDLHFSDDEVLADVLPSVKQLKRHTQLVGAYGVRLYTGETYQDGHHINTPKGHGQCNKSQKPLGTRREVEVDLVKGRIILAHQDCAHGLTTGFAHYHTDLYLSMTLAGRRRFHHFVSGQFFDNCDFTDVKKCKPRLIDFPVDNKGYCDLDGHYADRDELCQSWVINCLPNHKVRSRPSQDQEPRDTFSPDS